ncbi:MAG: hypothetical protein ABH956_01160 [Candidatus Nealsonbacteria bacterium]
MSKKIKKSLKKIKKKEFFISLQDATRYCEYSQEYLSLRARQGKLKAKKDGRNWVTKKEWLKIYVAKVEKYKNNLIVKSNIRNQKSKRQIKNQNENGEKKKKKKVKLNIKIEKKEKAKENPALFIKEKEVFKNFDFRKKEKDEKISKNFIVKINRGSNENKKEQIIEQAEIEEKKNDWKKEEEIKKPLVHGKSEIKPYREENLLVTELKPANARVVNYTTGPSLGFLFVLTFLLISVAGFLGKDILKETFSDINRNTYIVGESGDIIIFETTELIVDLFDKTTNESEDIYLIVDIVKYSFGHSANVFAEYFEWLGKGINKSYFKASASVGTLFKNCYQFISELTI